jgi:hypothetical protein
MGSTTVGDLAPASGRTMAPQEIETDRGDKFPAVEISDPAAANTDEPKRESRLSRISEVEIN